MTEKITMIELFSGIGAQERALRQLGLPYEVINTCDCDKDATLSYAAMRWDLEKEMESFEFPSQSKMIEELQAKNLGYDFMNGKHTITERTPIPKLKQYYIADRLSRNLGDIGKVERLPYTDFWTYSYPCTDLSVAGKGEGMVNKCDKCDHSWPINFENPKTNNICPNCGNIDIKSTRSGLLGQVQRLLTVSYEEGTLPKYLLLENVKNLVGSKFKPQFDAWVNWLDLIGYNTYYKVLNAKHYGIPQNRERVFAISIRKDIDTKGFIFPESIPLTTRLKDVLEKNVDEKYYLPDDRIEKIINSTFMQEKKRIQMTDVCDTLLARDWEDPKCVPIEEDAEVKQLMNIMPTKTRDNPNQGRVYDVNGIAPTLTKMDGGNREPMVIDKIKVVDSHMQNNHDNDIIEEESKINIKERFFRQVAETILENKCEPGDIIDAFNKKVNHSGICPTITTRPEGFKTAILPIVEEHEPFVVASRGRYTENSCDTAPTEQKLEPNFSGCTNTLTSVQKDNYVCEPQVLRAERTEYGKTIRKQYEAGEIDEKIGNMREMRPRTDGVSNTITTLLKDNYVAEPIIYDDYNSRISSDQDAINTLTCNCGASAERNGVKIIEPIVCEERKDEGIRLFKDDCVGTLRTIDACGDKRVLEPEEAEPPKIKWRIRKLMPIECWKLMGFSRGDHNRAAKFVSNSALYKQAGNSIVVNVLISLMSSLFIENGHRAEVWTKYTANLDD